VQRVIIEEIQRELNSKIQIKMDHMSRTWISWFPRLRWTL